MKKNILLMLFVCSGLVILLSQCKKEPTADDTELFNKGLSTNGYTYYKNNTGYLNSSAESGHKSSPFFKVRFNDIAQAALNDSGRLPAGGSFPDGSVVVKELYNAQNGELSVLAVMEKSASNSLAGNGWLWGEYYADGSLGFSVSKKGSSCTGCHSTNDRDYIRLFEIYP